MMMPTDYSTADLSPVQTNIDFDRPGKQTGYLRVPHSRNSSAWGALMIPIVVMQNGSGPTVLFIGGMHGGEHEGTVSLLKLNQSLTVEELQGRIIIIPALNLPAVVAGQRTSPIDQQDLNRVFPGKWDGTISQIIAHYIHEVILPLCDAVIDLHSGGYSLSILPYMSMHYLDNELQRQQTLAAMQAFDAPLSLMIREISGEGLLDYAVEKMGKIFLCGELGSAGTLRPEPLQIAEQGIWNLLKHFQMVEGEITYRQPANRLMEVPDADFYHTALSNGLYETCFNLGDWVEAGQPVGQIHFVENLSQPSHPVIAQQSGLLLCTRGPGHVEIGDCVAVLAQPAEAG